MNKQNRRLFATLLTICLPLAISHTALADSGNVGQVNSFIKSVITAVAGLSGLIATGFFVIGGFKYITSSGNPMHLDQAKRTIMYSAVGLAITIGAFVLSNIVGGLASSAFGG
jgi:hypothetical protein